MEVKLRYGHTEKKAEIPKERIRDILHGKTTAGGSSDPIAEALRNPIGTPRLREIVSPGEKIVILTSDISRPMPTPAVLPYVLDELDAAGVRKEDLTLVFAIGSHRRHTGEERRLLAGERAFREIRCIDSDPEDCIHLGETRRGTPVDITRTVAGADRRICLGNIDYHYFAGYSGGVKALMPGASTPAAIQKNHSMMLSDLAAPGIIAGNPIREDLEEAVRFCPVDFMLNVILDEDKKIVDAVAGDLVLAHREGCRRYDEMYRVPIREQADIVIASQGGAPKDLNLYQMQKALDNAGRAVKEGGTIILVGACNEGLGNKTFGEWLEQADGPESLTNRIKREFRLGGHKAAAIAMVRERASIKLVSELDPALARKAFMEPYEDLQRAVDDALSEKPDAGIIIMPYAGATLPSIVREQA